MSRVFLIDSAFAHHPHSVSLGYAQFSLPAYAHVWQRVSLATLYNATSGTFILTDQQLYQYLQQKKSVAPAVLVIAWLLEPEVIQPDIYSLLQTQLYQAHKGARIDRVWTHDLAYQQQLWHMSPKLRIEWIPNAMTFIAPHQWRRGSSVVSAEPITTALFSAKHGLPAYELRHRLFHSIELHRLVRFQGGITGQRFADTAQALSCFQFALVVENNCVPGYFSEKLLDCFLLSVVPVIYGDESEIGRAHV